MTARAQDPPDSAGALAALERRGRSQARLATVLILVVLGFAGLVLRQDQSIRDLTETLNRRADLLDHIERSSAQQVCADELEVAWEEAVTVVILAAVDDDDPALVAARADLAEALDRLARIEVLCPPVTVEEP